MEEHSFIDQTSRLFSSFKPEQSTDFLKTKSIESNDFEITGKPSFFNLRLILSPSKVIHKRAVYDILTLLGDLGGLFSSMYFIGAIINALLTG